MKAITTTLYACSGLMIAATIFGAIDYSSASSKGTLDNLYKEEKPIPALADKSIGIEDYSRGEINPAEEMSAVAVAKNNMIIKENPKTAKPSTRKKKRLNYKQFSRSKIVVEPIEFPDSLAVKR